MKNKQYRYWTRLDCIDHAFDQDLERMASDAKPVTWSTFRQRLAKGESDWLVLAFPWMGWRYNQSDGKAPIDKTPGVIFRRSKFRKVSVLFISYLGRTYIFTGRRPE